MTNKVQKQVKIKQIFKVTSKSKSCFFVRNKIKLRKYMQGLQNIKLSKLI